MHKSFQHAFAATLLTVLTLYVWRLGYTQTDWAILALLPLTLVIFVGFWPLAMAPWRATLRIALRHDSRLNQILTGKLRATFISSIFSIVAVTLLAWQALSASISDAAILLTAFVLSSCLFATGQAILLRHFHQPFARGFATSLVTWVIALPFTLIIAVSTWSWTKRPGGMLDASFQDALMIGIEKLPDRGGWVASVLAIPSGYEAGKLWVVIQLRDYPIVAALFCLEAALLSFVLCRAAVVITQFVETHVSREND